MYNPYQMYAGMPNYNQFQQMPQQQVSQQQSPQSGIVHVQTEEEWRNYPVAPGNTIIFKNDNAPFIYTKTMDSSQLGQPIFEKFRLVKETDGEESVAETKAAESAFSADIKGIKSDIKFIKDKISEMDKRKRAVVVDNTKKGGDKNE